MLRLVGLMGFIFFSAALCPSARSADVQNRIYVKAPTSDGAYNWSGAYIGLNAGGAWGSVTPNYASQSGVTTAAGLAFIQGLVNPEINSSGFIGGGQLGYNYQNQKFVYGFEADVDYTGLGKTRSTGTFGLPVCGGPCSIIQSYNTDWLATFRGRFGVTMGSLLVYGTGGLALAGVRYSDTFNLPTSVSAGSSNSVRTGWALGVGAELPLNPNWSVKAEYLRVDLGTTSYALINNLIPTATLQVEHQLIENIARLGINYKF
jgi:outer membrane immunogenic protein